MKKYDLIVKLRGGGEIWLAADELNVKELQQRFAQDMMRYAFIKKNGEGLYECQTFEYKDLEGLHVAMIHWHEVAAWYLTERRTEDQDAQRRMTKLAIEAQEIQLRILRKQAEDLEGGDKWKD